MNTALRPAAGFTMIELVVTLTIGAILVAVGVPSMSTFIQDQRLTTQANSLVLSLNFARSEAIKRDLAAGVQMCVSSDGATCTGGSGSWQAGWIVPDPTNAGNPALQGVPAVGGANTIVEANALTAVVFQPNGTVVAQASFRVCDSRGASKARAVDVSASGRILAATTPGKATNGITALVCP
jgi:type IV fimbrial biogenesis protein FimT